MRSRDDDAKGPAVGAPAGGGAPAHLLHIAAGMGMHPGFESRASAALWAILTLTAACTRESVTAVTVTEVSVTPPAVSTPQGEVVPFSATVRDENGQLHDAPVVWSSDDPSIATVDEDGIARAVSPGTTKIRAAFQDATGEAQVTVVSTASPPDDPGGGGGGDDPCLDVPLLPDLCVRP